MTTFYEPISMKIAGGQLLYCWESYLGNFWAPVGLFSVKDADGEPLDFSAAFEEPQGENKESVFDMSTVGIGVVTVGLMVAILSFD